MKISRLALIALIFASLSLQDANAKKENSMRSGHKKHKHSKSGQTTSTSTDETHKHRDGEVVTTHSKGTRIQKTGPTATEHVGHDASMAE